MSYLVYSLQITHCDAQFTRIIARAATLLAAVPDGTEASYYRTSGGAEIDLLLRLPGSELWAIEIKRSTAPSPSRGFHEAAADLHPARHWLVYPGNERFPLRDAEAVPLRDLADDLRKMQK